MRKSCLTLVIACGALLTVVGARAGVVYDNGGPNQYSSYYADSSYAITEVADPFMLGAGTTTIDGVNWWGTCVDPATSFSASCPTGDFTIDFFADSSGAPGTLLASYGVGDANQTATGNFIGGFYTEYSYSAGISDPGLSAGTQYWLGISNSTDSSVIWAMETSTSGAVGGHDLLFPPSTWVGNPNDLAFNLTGPSSAPAIPEPGTLVLLSSGFGLLAALRRKRS
jgi:hypothetical protein